MENIQEELFHEDLNDALWSVIKVLGGPKTVGVELWPSLSADTAGRKINHCLNNEHAQQFHPHEIMWLLAEGRKRGVHTAMAFLCRETGYADPQPIEPEDEIAKLQRQFIEAQKGMAAIIKKMESMTDKHLKRVS